MNLIKSSHFLSLNYANDMCAHEFRFEENLKIEAGRKAEGRESAKMNMKMPIEIEEKSELDDSGIKDVSANVCFLHVSFVCVCVCVCVCCVCVCVFLCVCVLCVFMSVCVT
jgi:hypothetical protein